MSDDDASGCGTIMKKYIIDHGNDKYTEIPKDIIYKIIIEHYQKSYHVVFGFSGLVIGFLLAIIAGR
jgi:hypothetical protein